MSSDELRAGTLDVSQDCLEVFNDYVRGPLREAIVEQLGYQVGGPRVTLGRCCARLLA